MIVPSKQRNNNELTMKTTLSLLLLLTDLTFACVAGERYETLVINGKARTNVEIVSATPSGVTLTWDGGGGVIKRQDLPPELREKYPLDAKEAAAHEQEQAVKAKTLREQQRTESYAAGLRHERAIQAKIDQARTDLVGVQKEIRAWRAKPKKTPGRAVAINRLIDKRMSLERHIEDLTRQLESVRKLTALNR